MNSKEIVKVKKEIESAKSKLIDKANKKGLYENFGQEEVRKLEDKWTNNSIYDGEMNYKRKLIRNFDDWCQTYTGK